MATVRDTSFLYVWLYVLLSVCLQCLHALDVRDICKGDLHGAQPSSCIQMRAIIHCYFYCNGPTEQNFGSTEKIGCDTEHGKWLNDTTRLCADLRGSVNSWQTTTLTMAVSPTYAYDPLSNNRTWVSIPIIMTGIGIGFILIYVYIQRRNKHFRHPSSDRSSQTHQASSYPEVYAPPDDIAVYVIANSDTASDYVLLPSYETAVLACDNSPPPYSPKETCLLQCSSGSSTT